MPLALSRRAFLTGAAPAPAVAVAPARPARAPNLGEVVRKAHAQGRAPGASCAVLVGGRLTTSVAGWADPQRQLPMTPQTRLMSGSIGKTFCAATVMSLAADGALDLDAPVARHFADEPWYARLPNARALTLRMLLMHTEGFPQFLDEFAFQRTFLADAFAGRDTGYSPRKMLSFILDKPPLAAPGTQHHYSDLGYHLVGLTIEKLTGRGYYEVLQERVLSRLGTADIVPATRRDIPGLAAGYARGDLIAALAGTTGRTTDMAGVLRHNPALEYTGGGLAVTPRALADFFARLATGRIVAPAQFVEMMGSSIALPSHELGVEARYGLGLFISKRPGFGRYVSHSGYFPGYLSNVGYFLDHGVAAAVQVNTDNGPDVFQLLRDAAATSLRPSTRAAF